MFPCEIWERIFSLLKTADTSTLLAGRETCRDFKYWVDAETSLWSRMSLHRAVQDEENLEICRLIIENVEEKNPEDKRGRTPIRYAVDRGHLEICRLIIENVEDKNPKDDNGRTPLHWAAKGGHLEVCRLIKN